MRSFFRAIGFAIQDIFRNFTLSMMTVFILILMLLSVNSFIVIQALTDHAIQAIKQQIDVSVYFDPSVAQEEVVEVRSYVESFPEVTSISYLSKDEVLQAFQDKHADNPDILESIAELPENPLGPTMIIKTREPRDYRKIIDGLSVPEYDHLIEAKTFADTEVIIERVDTTTEKIEQFVIVLSLLFVIISFFVIFNTIRVAIYTQRTEIAIKKLVGATNWFIRGPYVFQAILFSIIATLATFGILFAISGFIDPYIQAVFATPGFLTNYLYSNIMSLLLVEFGAVLVLTVLTSTLAMRRYLST